MSLLFLFRGEIIRKLQKAGKSTARINIRLAELGLNLMGLPKMENPPPPPVPKEASDGFVPKNPNHKPLPKKPTKKRKTK